MEISLDTKEIGILSEPKESKKPNLEVVDSRKLPDPKQAENLSAQIESDDVLSSLEEAKTFLGKYSTRSPQELSVNIIDGTLGEGAIKGSQIDIQMPAQADAISQLKKFLKPSFGEISEEVADKLTLALTTSTILHEGVHGILDSTPTSQLAIDYEKASEAPNTGGEVVTLLDEGIAYAIQSRYARKVEPIGSLAPRTNEQDSPAVKRRKALGKKLEPKVGEYIEAGKEIDDEFLVFASQAIKEVENL